MRQGAGHEGLLDLFELGRSKPCVPEQYIVRPQPGGGSGYTTLADSEKRPTQMSYGSIQLGNEWSAKAIARSKGGQQS